MKRFLLILCILPLCTLGQRPTVRARLTPDSVAIGDRFGLEVTVDKDLMQLVDFPVFEGGMLVDGIEIVDEGGVDTLKQNGRRLTLGKRYTLTTFEDGEHALGRFPALYADKNIVDTLLSEDSLVLRVGTFAIDTATMRLRDLKPAMGVRFRVGEVSGYFGLAAAFMAAVVAAVWWLRGRRRRRIEAARPAEPPHVEAIKALEALHGQKLWQSGRHKLYYTALTDILRRYMEGRWGIAAMEMTSGEIVDASAAAGIEIARVRPVLRCADLVKFAKRIPAAAENEDAYTQVYYFVEETKPEQEVAV